MVMQDILREDHVHFLDANPEIREFLEQVNRDQAAIHDAKVEKKGKKLGDLPDIRRLEMDKKPERNISNPNQWDRILESTAFESPSSMTEEDSDEREALS